MPVPVVPRPTRGRPRLNLARRPSLFWLAALVVAAATGLSVARFVGHTRAEAARWGDLRPTLVATADLEPGTVLGPHDVRVERRPRALVPTAALPGRPGDLTVVAAIAEGEPVLPARLAPVGLSATAAALPPGTVGVAVPTGPGALVLEAGDAVDVPSPSAPTPWATASPRFRWPARHAWCGPTRRR